MWLKTVIVCALSLTQVMVASMGNDTPSPREALEHLLEGNRRYQREELLHPNRSQESRFSLARQQRPIATILGCSDSRVSPEILFDQGIGDLFVVRVAGNVVGSIELDSLEYAVLFLGAPLVMVLGHESCGAVQAVMEGNTRWIQSVAGLIAPAIEEAKKQKGGELKNAVRDNVLHVVAHLRKIPDFAALIREGKLAIVGGYYDFTEGSVTLVTDI